MIWNGVGLESSVNINTPDSGREQWTQECLMPKLNLGGDLLVAITCKLDLGPAGSIFCQRKNLVQVINNLWCLKLRFFISWLLHKLWLLKLFLSIFCCCCLGHFVIGSPSNKIGMAFGIKVNGVSWAVILPQLNRYFLDWPSIGSKRVWFTIGGGGVVTQTIRNMKKVQCSRSDKVSWQLHATPKAPGVKKGYSVDCTMALTFEVKIQTFNKQT